MNVDMVVFVFSAVAVLAVLAYGWLTRQPPRDRGETEPLWSEPRKR